MPRDGGRAHRLANVLGHNSNWIALAAPALIVGALLANGAMTPTVSILLVLAGAILLLSVAADRRLRDELSRSRVPRWPALAFFAVLFVVAWSLTPFAPGGAHPVWEFTGQTPGAATADRSRTALELIRLCGLACFFVVGAAAGGQDQRADLAVKITLLAGAGLALWSLGAQATGYFGPQIRLHGPFGNPNITATTMGLLFMLALALTVRTLRGPGLIRSVSGGLPNAGAALIFLICLMMTASRGGALSTALGLVAFGLLYVFGRGEPPKRAGWWILAGIGVLAVIVGATSERLFVRIDELQLGDTVRETVFKTHWQAFTASPWMGNGLGNFDIVNRTLIDSGNMKDIWSVRAAHNVYLSWLELGGLLATAPMFLCIGAILFQALRGALRRSRMTTVLFGLLAADVVVLAHGATDFALEYYGFAVLWSFLLGLQYTLAQGSSR